MTWKSKAALSTILLSGITLTANPLVFAAKQIGKVEFVGTQNPHQIIIRGDGPINVEQIPNAQDKQLIVEIKDAQLANKSSGLKLDTSSFDSKVSLVSPYQVEGEDTVRVVVQLRDMVNAEVKPEGNMVRIMIPTDQNTPMMSAGTGDTPPPPINEASKEKVVAARKEYTDKLEEFFDNQNTKNFVGKHITLQLKDAPATDVFRLIAEASGFNIILGEDVKGSVTISLVDVPWDLALDTLLNTLRLGAERNGNVLRIVTLANLTAAKQEQLKAKKAAEASAPRVTRIFPISYARPAELVTILSRFSSQVAAGDTSGAKIPVMQVDERTNSIIVEDLPENIERMKKLITLLDTQTPQILIEAKIVEATENFSKEISGGLGFGRTSSTNVYGTYNQVAPLDPLIGGPLEGASNVNKAQFGMSTTLAFLRDYRLNALLNINESENKIKIVSAPKTVVLNKQKAVIIQGTPVLIPGSSTTQLGGVVQTTNVQDANLSLTVTPTVTNDGNILMDLIVTNDVAVALPEGGRGVAKRSVNSRVVSETGTTLVIGGVFTSVDRKQEAGVPFLRKIPILGSLFGSKIDNGERTELFIFITPRILNEKEAGMTPPGQT